MSEKTLKFHNIRVSKDKFHKFTEPINLNLVNIDRIVISEKFKHNDEGFIFFIGTL